MTDTASTNLDPKAVALGSILAPFDLDAIDMDMLMRGDMLGSKGAKVLAALEALASAPQPSGISGELPAAVSVADGWGEHQHRVAAWMIECFGPKITMDRVERADRFIEEALELAQATGWTADRGHALVDYVFGRPVGEIGQEVGGVMVTLAALCNVFEIDIEAEARREVDRITQPEIVLKIRAKQATKPTGSALPAAAPQPPQPVKVDEGMVERAARAICIAQGYKAGELDDIGRISHLPLWKDKLGAAAAALTAALSHEGEAK